MSPAERSKEPAERSTGPADGQERRGVFRGGRGTFHEGRGVFRDRIETLPRACERSASPPEPSASLSRRALPLGEHSLR
jgi:hypothetical protein